MKGVSMLISSAKGKNNTNQPLMGSVGQDDLFDYSTLFFEKNISPYYRSNNGILFSDDCMTVLPMIKDSSINMIFADPPFNIGKIYRNNTNDNLSDAEYISWCKLWIKECVRVLNRGGSLFIYNLPKWNIFLGAYLNEIGMTFRHWIAVEISSCLPIQGKLHPSHYSLLYFTKGKPATFHRIRIPVALCRHCGGEIKDYGGHRSALNPNGLTLKDVWTDIPPVRHSKFKSKDRKANALSTKLVSRAIQMSTNTGDTVLDPFGGSGTTYACCEQLGRKWVGIEIDYADDIVYRLHNPDIKSHRSDDYVEG